jgi:hypothetical protein
MMVNLHKARVDDQPFHVGLVGEDAEELLPHPFVAPADEAPMRVAPSP